MMKYILIAPVIIIMFRYAVIFLEKTMRYILKLPLGSADRDYVIAGWIIIFSVMFIFGCAELL